MYARIDLYSRHRHHRVDDENAINPRKGGNSMTPVPHRHHVPHHHHPDGTIHYHRHSKPSNKTPPIPATKIINDSILETVRNVPKRHLGTVLYCPSIESPTSPASFNSKLDYVSKPYTIPQCDGKENCTLTVRIPRFYLSKDHREQVTLGRAVWGTDVYSDDSDPLAAAIHAGWIRGEWGDSIDFSMLELTLPPDSNLKLKETTFSMVPPSPMLPPPGKALHITLLILPALQKYTSRITHGIKSRAWGADHDGLSYRIEKIAWVDEKAGRAEERDGESRRKRLKMSMGCKVPTPTLRLGTGKGMGVSDVAMAAA